MIQKASSVVTGDAIALWGRLRGILLLSETRIRKEKGIERERERERRGQSSSSEQAKG